MASQSSTIFKKENPYIEFKNSWTPLNGETLHRVWVPDEPITWLACDACEVHDGIAYASQENQLWETQLNSGEKRSVYFDSANR